MDDTTPTSRWPFAAALLLVLIVAAGLRLYRLPELPLGLHYDEAANGILASEVARGTETPVFIPSYTGKEVLFFYWAGLWMKLLGTTELALRLSAALAGLATVVATIWAVRELLHGQRDADWIALLTGTFLATSFWHLILSRYGFRAVTQPLLQALTVAALWRGLRLPPTALPPNKGGLGRKGAGGSPPWLILAGLLCGLTAYTYLAARAFPIPLAMALLTLLIADRGHRRARLGQLTLFVAVAALTLTPLAHYWLTHPGSFLNRTQQVAAANWAEAWDGIRACLGMFFLQGDPYIRFNLPHRPLFDPVTAILFLLGFAVAVWQFIRLLRGASRSPAPCPLASVVFLLTYLPIMLLPSALATGEITPSNLRTAGLLPFVYLFPALGLAALKAQISRHSSLVIRHSSVIILLLVLLTPITAVAYFRDWASSSALYYTADGDLADVATHLNQADLTATTPYVASIHYRHPTLAFLAEDYERIRWLTGGQTIVFPAEGDALLVFPRSASEYLSWVRSVLPDDSLIPTAAPPGPDGMPAFHAYRVGPVLSETESHAPSGSIEPAEVPVPTHPLTADIAHIALLLGYDVVGEPRSGESAEVTVWFRVLNAPDRGDYGPVVHLTDPWGFVWGEAYPFHYPSEQWMPGEWIVDHLSIPVAIGTPPGDYLVHFSLYSSGADSLLPVLDDAGRYAGTAVELPLHLARATTPALPVPSEVEKPPHPNTLDDLSIRTRLDVHTGGLTLLGVNLDTKSARPGERLYVTLFWQADEPPLPDTDVHLSLGDTTLYAGAPVHGTYPTSGWTAGEVVVDRYDPRLPLDTPPGDYPLRLRLGTGSATSGSGQSQTEPAPEHWRSQPLDLGTVTVQATERAFDVPPISHLLTATLGGQVQLLGYDLLTPIPASAPYERAGGPTTAVVAPGDTITLTLYWRALTEMDEDYTVFTHLLAPDGSMTGQRDNPPVGGTYPTSLWLAGEVVTDVYTVPIRADGAPGEHRLKVGMYVAETGARLPLAGTPYDSIPLQTITVTGTGP